MKTRITGEVLKLDNPVPPLEEAVERLTREALRVCDTV
jgi:hypothetical protein